MARIHIIGGGLAGSEAAWQALAQGIPVTLYEMRGQTMTPAHNTSRLAELVCSNSLKSMQRDSVAGLLKEEMRALGSLVVEAGYATRVPAGQALAVDRELFSSYVEAKLTAHPLFTRVESVVEEIPRDIPSDECWIVATGPLTHESLAESLLSLCGGDARQLYFYDAIAPIISADSIDYQHCFFASRYDKDQGENLDGDYLNIPLNKEEYEQLITDIAYSEKSPLHAFESTKYFEACLPVEVMIERGRETLRFGPMKPVGLYDPKTNREPWAVLQLRAENKDRTMFSMVGFQTKMKWPEQKRVFSKLAALRDVEFFRYGSVHRNTYLSSPKVLGEELSFLTAPQVFLAGQITGVEGYTESSAMGLIAGRAAVSKLTGGSYLLPPPSSVMGALLNYVTKGVAGEFQPMNCNFGLMPSLNLKKRMAKAERRRLQCERARHDFANYLNQLNSPGLTFTGGGDLGVNQT